MHDNSSIHGTVIYDGMCGVCQMAMDYFKKKDHGAKLEIIAYQLGDLPSISPRLTEQMADKAICFVRKDGTLFVGARGVYEMLRQLSGIWGIFGAAMTFRPLSILSNPFYRAFASNRHYVSRLVGLRECIKKTYDDDLRVADSSQYAASDTNA